MSNQLAHETSPYLLQHAENPVNWYPWNEEALQLAHAENKPIFLSIGYSSCHWCHVMAHESFEDPEIAALLNKSFISIKVDREERPDIDSIYMNAVVAMTGQGGWPMSVFLTPDGKPFFGGTYFPPIRRYGSPSFRDVLVSITRSWQEAPAEIIPVAEKLTRHLQESSSWGGWENQPLREETIRAALMELDASYDWTGGGWGQMPKFPAPMTIEFLLQQAYRGNQKALEMAAYTLSAMANGGMYDVIGGGFHRYSTDTAWFVPHFEKMLYDNAQLALVYLHAYQITGESTYRRICEQTLDFMIRDLLQPAGGFSSSLDADSEGEEGKTYLWTYPELQTAIDHPDDFDWLKQVFTLSANGNFEGKIILRLKQSLPALAFQMGLSLPEFTQKLDRLLARLLAHRSKRIQPLRDDKVLTFWNSLAMQAFAEAGKVLDRKDYLKTAQKNARFLLSELFEDGQLLRSWRNGKAQNTAFLEDYAGLVLGLLVLYQADFDPYWFQAAYNIAMELKSGFADPDGGFFDTHASQDMLLIRPKDIQDNATPSGNALAVMALARLAKFVGDDSLNMTITALLGNLQEMMARYPNAFAYWLQNLDFSMSSVQEVILVWPEDLPTPEQYLLLLKHAYKPFSVQAAAALPLPDGVPSLLKDRQAVEGQPTLYLCENFTCKSPINRVDEFEKIWLSPQVEENPT
ncbi:MAG TPA: thioredoxin domain-containing protein [Longilinea sp.]|nr:thioredoxin domain-containing protein [Longilinea sp.]